MQELLTVVTRKGQITLPAQIRRSLGIVEGDRIAVWVADAQQAHVMLRPVRSVAEATFGAVPAGPHPIDPRKLRELFEQSMAARGGAGGPPAADREG